MTKSKKLIYFSLLTALFSFSLLQIGMAAEAIEPVTEQDYSILAGDWQRTDGSYSIRVSNVQKDGRVKVEYFNPNPIHVEQATISTRKGLAKLFIQLQDKGYEGSTYTLYYYAEKDALAGFYYQATSGKTYKVIFMRKGH